MRRMVLEIAHRHRAVPAALEDALDGVRVADREPVQAVGDAGIGAPAPAADRIGELGDLRHPAIKGLLRHAQQLSQLLVGGAELAEGFGEMAPVRGDWRHFRHLRRRGHAGVRCRVFNAIRDFRFSGIRAGVASLLGARRKGGGVSP
jgi:hypothetical protein